MNLKDKIVIVTGAASGIGKALCERFKEEGATGIAAVDINEEGALSVAQSVGGIGFGADVANESDIIRVVEETEHQYGRIDVFVSNAGILIGDPSHAASASNEEWDRILSINLKAHLYAARAMLPRMIERESGYLLNTASAAGLLNQIDYTPYAVSKHAAIGFAESLAIAHHDDGIRVSVICPQSVRTGMTGKAGSAARYGMLETDAVCDAVIQGMDEERFLILPHPEVLNYMQRKTADYDRWLRGMRGLRDRMREEEK